MFLLSRENERWIWHKKLEYVNLKHISKLPKKDLVKGLPNIFEKLIFCAKHVSKGNKSKLFLNLKMFLLPDC